MIVYLAGEGANKDVWESHVPRRLMTYFYHGYKKGGPTNEVLHMAAQKKDLFLDSGAYSAFTKKETIDLKDFMGFCKKTQDYWTVIAALDVIGDYHQSWSNYRAMVDAGLNAFPTFHYGEPWDFLEQMLEEAPYMALGGLVGAHESVQQAWLDEAWSRMVDKKGRPRNKVHGFGMTTHNLILRYPWYSVDSTSWLMQAMYGKACLWLGNRMITIFMSEKHSSVREVDGWHYNALTLAKGDTRKIRVDKALADLGFTAEQVANNYTDRLKVNAVAYRAFEGRAPLSFVKPQLTLFE